VPSVAAPTEPGTPSWQQVPPVPPPDLSWESALLAWVLTALPMAVQFTRLQYTPGTFVPALLAALVVALLVRLHWLAALVGAAVLVPVIMLRNPVFSGVPVVLLFAVVLTWTVATGAFQPAWSRWPAPPARRAVSLAMVLVVASLLFQTGVRVPVALLGVAWLTVLLCLLLPRPVGRAMGVLDPVVRAAGPVVRVNRWVLEHVGHVLGTVLGFLAMVPVAVVTLLVWVVQRVVRFDPLDPPAHDGTRWVERTGDDAEPGRAFAKVTVREPRSTGFRARRLTAGVLSTAVLLALLLFTTFTVRALMAGEGLTDAVLAAANRAPAALNCQADVDVVMDGQDNWPQVGCETSDYVGAAQYDGVTTYRYADFAGKWVNVKDGVRRTWQPPPCDCRRLTVWWFGGSAAWGFYQGDETSLPSQVAKAAWEQGIALDIVNYATPGWTLGQSVRKFAELGATQPAPDLAVFMDGANDLTLQITRNNLGAGEDGSDGSFVEGALDQVLRKGYFDAGLDKIGTSVGGADQRQSDRQVGRVAAQRLARGVRQGQLVGEAIGTPVAFFLQPVLVSAPRRLGGPDAMPAKMRRQNSAAWPEIRRALAPGVIDLSDVYDDVDRTIFKDSVHVNEYGAQVLAQQMFTDLRPSLAAAAASAPRN